jgi:ankyrin repeat protein
VLNDRLDAAEFMLDHGADIDAIVPGTPMPVTILHKLVDIEAGALDSAEAIENRRLPAIRFLLDRGASVTILEDTYHATAIGWAQYQGRRLMLDLLSKQVPESR